MTIVQNRLRGKIHYHVWKRTVSPTSMYGLTVQAFNTVHCGFLLSRSIWTDEIQEVDCKICLQRLACKVGLTKDTPAGVISDRFKELNDNS